MNVLATWYTIDHQQDSKVSVSVTTVVIISEVIVCLLGTKSATDAEMILTFMLTKVIFQQNCVYNHVCIY